MTDLLGAAPAAPTGVLDRPLRATTIGLVSIVTLIALEAMAVATALPTAVRDLDGLAYYGWSFTAFLIANIVGMVAAGELSDRLGPARPMVLGLVVFTVGLVVAGMAPEMGLFVLGRAVQGYGSGVIIVAIYVVIAEVYTEALRPQAFAAVSAAWVVPALVGPVVAGLLAQHVSWRAVFLGLPPFVAAGTALLFPSLRRLPTAAGARTADDATALTRPAAPAGPGELPKDADAPGTHNGTDPPPPRVRRVAVSGRGGRFIGVLSWRWAAALAAAVGIATVQYAGQRPAWTLLPAALAGLGLLALGLRRLLPAGTARIRAGVPAVVAFRGIVAGSFFAVESLVPLTLTVVHGFSPTAAGVPLMVGAFGWSAAAWWQGRRPDVPRDLLVRAGFALIAVGALAMAVVAQPATPGWLAYPAWAVAGLGAGLTMPSIGVLLLALTPVADRGANSAALQISDAVGSALCIGLGGVLVAAAARGAFSLSTVALVFDPPMAALAVTGALLAARARDPDCPAPGRRRGLPRG